MPLEAFRALPVTHALLFGADASDNPVKLVTNALGHLVQAPEAGERDINGTNNHSETAEGWNYTLCTASTDVSLGVPSKLKSVRVTVATAVAAINVRDSAAAGTGNIVQPIPLGAAINTVFPLDGIKLLNGIYVNYDAGATGTLIVVWRPTGVNS